jgi:hypothetical protein
MPRLLGEFGSGEMRLFMHPRFVLKASIDSITAYRKVMEKDVEGGRSVSAVPMLIFGKPPLIGSYKVNWDAALDKQNGCMGYDYICEGFEWYGGGCGMLFGEFFD